MKTREQSLEHVQYDPKAPDHILATLLASLREYKKPSILAPAFVLVESLLEIIIPTIMAALIDQGINGKSMPAIVRFGLVLLTPQQICVFVLHCDSTLQILRPVLLLSG